MIYGFEKNKSINSNLVNTIDVSGGTYVRFVFIGSSNCVYSNHEDTHRTVSSIKNELNSVFKQSPINFISTGITYDMSSIIGIQFLEKTGPYNELLVGAGPLNLGIINYSSRGSSTPRVLLFLEQYDTDVFGLNMNNFYDSQKLLKSYAGLYDLFELHDFLQSSSDHDIVKYFDLENLY